MGRRIACVLVAAALALVPGAASAQEPGLEEGLWYDVEGGEVTVDLYFFWSSTCPHCREALPFIEAMGEADAGIDLHSYQVDGGSDAFLDVYEELIAATGLEADGVPAFYWCGAMVTGYDDDEGRGAYLQRELASCREQLQAAVGGDEPVEVAVEEESISLPLIGSVEDMSLPGLTVALATVDAFNPCAFFVLLFLLSLLVRTKSRSRMAIVGGVFVLFSGLVYFAFMAAWLNAFRLVGPIRWITAVAGVVAIGMAILNIKDYFWFKRGPSLSISETAQPGLFGRMRGLVGASSYPGLLGGTVVLALAANSYELLCTAGFPMVFTRTLTLEELPTGTYYAYLAVYNIIYVMPLLLIVAVFVWKRGAHKLTENEGRTLKLLSGVMMFQLGLVLVAAPEALSNIATAVGLVASSVVVTALVVIVDRRRRAGRPPPGRWQRPAELSR